jgi:hypothetical protein
VNQYFLNHHKQWGVMPEQSLQHYITWLYDKNIISRKPDVDKMIYHSAAVKV